MKRPPSNNNPGTTSLRATLDRLLSKLGITSRTESRQLIAAGRVLVNGRVATNADCWVLWPRDVVMLDGKVVAAAPTRFVLFHKPKGVVTTQRDERGRRSLPDVLPAELHGLQAVGRLDQATSGLLLLTNDTDLGNVLTAPTHRIEREYIVTVRGAMSTKSIEQGCDGLSEGGERLQWRRAELLKQSGRESHLRVILTEGKNREIRRICAALGHEVTRLRRIRFGPFSLEGLEPGNWSEMPIRDAREAVERLLQPAQ